MDLLQRTPDPETDQPYRVHTKGRVANTPFHATLGTYNQDCMLTVFLKGEGIYRKDGEMQHITPGMVGLVLPEHNPGVLFSSEDKPYVHLFCRFAGAHALQTARRISTSYNNAPYFSFNYWQELAEVMQRLALRPDGSANIYPDRMRQSDALLAQALSVLDCPPIIEETINMQSITRFIADNISQPMEIALMADHFCVSREYLCRKVKKVTGHTPLDLWRNQKIDWAVLMLSNGDITVQEVSRRLGFSDQYYFSKVFKKTTGKTPSQLIPGKHTK